ncbi:hypothetical protein Hte_009604 [Hypoxylon texense]
MASSTQQQQQQQQLRRWSSSSMPSLYNTHAIETEKGTCSNTYLHRQRKRGLGPAAPIPASKKSRSDDDSDIYYLQKWEPGIFYILDGERFVPINLSTYRQPLETGAPPNSLPPPVYPPTVVNTVHESDFTRRLGKWVNAVKPGSPSDSVDTSDEDPDMPKGKRSAVHADLDVMGSQDKKSKSSKTTTTMKGTRAYTRALEVNNILLVKLSDAPSDVQALCTAVQEKLKVGHDDIQSLTCFDNISHTFEDLIPKIVGSNETSVGELIRSLPIGGSTTLQTFMQLKGSYNPTLTQDLYSCADKMFRPEFYATFDNQITIAKPNTVTGIGTKWLQQSISKEIPDSLAAHDIQNKVIDSCELCNLDIVFPYLLAEFKGRQNSLEAMHELQGGFAAAWISGQPWIGQETVIFGLAAYPTYGELYVGWAQKNANGVVHYYSALVTSLFFTKRADVIELCHILIRIHLWGLGPRKTQLEADLKVSTAQALADRKKRQNPPLQPDSPPLRSDIVVPTIDAAGQSNIQLQATSPATANIEQRQNPSASPLRANVTFPISDTTSLITAAAKQSEPRRSIASGGSGMSETSSRSTKEQAIRAFEALNKATKKLNGLIFPSQNKKKRGEQ